MDSQRSEDVDAKFAAVPRARHIRARMEESPEFAALAAIERRIGISVWWATASFIAGGALGHWGELWSGVGATLLYLVPPLMMFNLRRAVRHAIDLLLLMYAAEA